MLQRSLPTVNGLKRSPEWLNQKRNDKSSLLPKGVPPVGHSVSVLLKRVVFEYKGKTQENVDGLATALSDGQQTPVPVEKVGNDCKILSLILGSDSGQRNDGFGFGEKDVVAKISTYLFRSVNPNLIFVLQLCIKRASTCNGDMSVTEKQAQKQQIIELRKTQRTKKVSSPPENKVN